MTPILCQQEADSFCFLACLQSFLLENGQFERQTDILKKAQHVLGNNPNDLGAFSNENWSEIERLYNLRVTPILGPFTITDPKESIFIIAKWMNIKGHWVRFIRSDADYFFFNNPASNHLPDPIKISEFNQWWSRWFKVEKL